MVTGCRMPRMVSDTLFVSYSCCFIFLRPRTLSTAPARLFGSSSISTLTYTTSRGYSFVLSYSVPSSVPRMQSYRALGSTSATQCLLFILLSFLSLVFSFCMSWISCSLLHPHTLSRSFSISSSSLGFLPTCIYHCIYPCCYRIALQPQQNVA